MEVLKARSYTSIGGDNKQLNNNSQSQEACPIQECNKAFGIPFLLSKLVSHLYEKHHNVELSAHAIKRFGLARCEICNKYSREGGLEDT